MPELAGEKGAALGRLAAGGFRVPGGFVLSAETYRDFVRAARVEPLIRRFSRLHADPYDPLALYTLDRIRLRILHTPLPEVVRVVLISAIAEAGIFGVPLAVRSSAVVGGIAPPPGLFYNALNVLDIRDVLQAVQMCWASLWLPRAVAFRRQAAITDTEAAMAVAIQRLIAAEAAGVALAPVADGVTIRAAWGLGEDVVTGAVDADVFRFALVDEKPQLERLARGSKETIVLPAVAGGVCRQPTTATQRQEPALSPTQAQALAETALRISQALEGPQQIEWLRLGDDIQLLQATPLPFVPQAAATGVAEAAFPWKQSFWTAAPFSDTVPRDPSPLTWSVLRLALAYSFTELSRRGGNPLPSPSMVVRRIQGKPSLNLTALQWLFQKRFGLDPAWTGRILGEEHCPAAALEGLPASGKAAWAQRVSTLRLMLNALRTVTHPPALRRRLARWEHLDLETKKDLELLSILYENLDAFLTLAPRYLLLGGWLEAAYSLLETRLRRVGSESREWTAALLSGPRPAAAEKLIAGLTRLAQAPEAEAEARLAEFLSQYGCRATPEIELRQPRWREDPASLLQGAAVWSALGAPERSPRSGSLRAVLPAPLSLQDKLHCRALCWGARRGDAARARMADGMLRLLSFTRLLFLEIGQRMMRRGHLRQQEDIFFLELEQIRPFLLGETPAGDLRALAEAHRRRAESEVMPAPDEEPAADILLPILDAAAGGDGVITGMPVSPGSAVGQARRVTCSEEREALRSGEIFVGGAAEAVAVLLFAQPAAVVLENGGFFSHAAALARARGIPAVARMPGIAAWLRDGDRIAVNGDTGRVIPRP